METGCNLDHFEPALNNFSPQITQDSEQTWTLDQVRHAARRSALLKAPLFSTLPRTFIFFVSQQLRSLTASAQRQEIARSVLLVYASVVD